MRYLLALFAVFLALGCTGGDTAIPSEGGDAAIFDQAKPGAPQVPSADCEGYADPDKKADCRILAAASSGDIRACDSVGRAYKDHCILYFAVNRKDPSVCDSMSTPQGRATCRTRLCKDGGYIDALEPVREGNKFGLDLSTPSKAFRYYLWALKNDDFKVISSMTMSSPEFDQAFEKLGGANAAGQSISQILYSMDPADFDPIVYGSGQTNQIGSKSTYGKLYRVEFHTLPLTEPGSKTYAVNFVYEDGRWVLGDTRGFNFTGPHIGAIAPIKVDRCLVMETAEGIRAHIKTDINERPQAIQRRKCTGDADCAGAFGSIEGRCLRCPPGKMALGKRVFLAPQEYGFCEQAHMLDSGAFRGYFYGENQMAMLYCIRGSGTQEEPFVPKS